MCLPISMNPPGSMGRRCLISHPCKPGETIDSMAWQSWSGCHWYNFSTCRDIYIYINKRVVKPWKKSPHSLHKSTCSYELNMNKTTFSVLSCLSTGPVLVLSHFMSTRMIAYAVSRPRRLSKSFIPKISNACFKKTKRRQKTSTKQPAHPKKKLPFNKNACFRTEDERRNGPGRRYIVCREKTKNFPDPKRYLRSQTETFGQKN